MIGTKPVVLEPIQIWINATYAILSIANALRQAYSNKCYRIIAGSLTATKNTWQSWATSQEIAKLVKEPGLGSGGSVSEPESVHIGPQES